MIVANIDVDVCCVTLDVCDVGLDVCDVSLNWIIEHIKHLSKV